MNLLNQFKKSKCLSCERSVLMRLARGQLPGKSAEMHVGCTFAGPNITVEGQPEENTAAKIAGPVHHQNLKAKRRIVAGVKEGEETFLTYPLAADVFTADECEHRLNSPGRTLFLLNQKYIWDAPIVG